MSGSRPHLAVEHPRLYKAAAASALEAEAAALEAGLTAGFVELLKVRVSQLNGCAFCLRIHSADALDKGESPERLAVLSAWRETAYFDPAEQAALGLAETATRIDRRRSAEEAASMASALSRQQASAVAWLAIAMNTFNRIALLSGYRVAPAPSQQAHA